MKSIFTISLRLAVCSRKRGKEDLCQARPGYKAADCCLTVETRGSHKQPCSSSSIDSPHSSLTIKDTSDVHSLKVHLVVPITIFRELWLRRKSISSIQNPWEVYTHMGTTNKHQRLRCAPVLGPVPKTQVPSPGAAFPWGFSPLSLWVSNIWLCFWLPSRPEPCSKGSHRLDRQWAVNIVRCYLGICAENTRDASLMNTLLRLRVYKQESVGSHLALTLSLRLNWYRAKQTWDIRPWSPDIIWIFEPKHSWS